MAGTEDIGRDVQFYLFSEPDRPLGGMRLNPSVSERNFLSMLDILIVASGPYRVTLRGTGDDLMRRDNAIQPSKYDIRPYSSRDTVAITDELCITRVLSRTSPGDKIVSELGSVRGIACA
ncbi:hypothetical protein V1515DRAFT_577747 [Lipomyces mesembrius]